MLIKPTVNLMIKKVIKKKSATISQFMKRMNKIYHNHNFHLYLIMMILNKSKIFLYVLDSMNPKLKENKILNLIMMIFNFLKMVIMSILMVKVRTIMINSNMILEVDINLYVFSQKVLFSIYLLVNKHMC